MVISNILPAGALPKWLLFVASLALFNTFQNFYTLSLTKRVYDGKPDEVTSLMARTFGAWTFFVSIVRAYAAYNLHNKIVYQIVIWTYVVVMLHYTSELYIFKTANHNPGSLSPVTVSIISLVWLSLQYNNYVSKAKDKETKVS